MKRGYKARWRYLTMSNETQPEIRFPGFAEAWEQRKLGDESDVRDGTHDSPKYYDKGYPLVTSKNLKDFGLDLSNVSFISYEDFEVINKRSKVDIGDILFGMIGTIGNPVLVDRADFAIKNVALIKEQKKILNSFLIQILKSPVFDKYIKNENAGGTQKFLSLSKVRDFNFLCPNIDEQNCISAFFKKLDDTIALHQRKLDLLKETKKGFLQKMFPKNGAKVPEIRFPGFTEDWEERKFSDFTKLSQGLQIAISDRFTEAGPNKEFYITNEFLNPNNTKKYYIENPSKNVIANKNDILMTRTGNTGKVVTNTKGAFHNNFFKIDYDPQKISKLFLYFLLTSIPIQKEILIRAGTSTIPDLNHKDFYNIKVYLPIFEEQKKIGSFFKQLDDTIALHQRKLDLLKETKKGFLQKMFV